MPYEVLYTWRTGKLQPCISPICRDAEFENEKRTTRSLCLDEFRQLVKQAVRGCKLKGESIVMLLVSPDLLPEGLQHGCFSLLQFWRGKRAT